MIYSTGFFAGDERIELPPKVLETPIISFDHLLSYRYYLDIITLLTMLNILNIIACVLNRMKGAQIDRLCEYKNYKSRRVCFVRIVEKK